MSLPSGRGDEAAGFAPNALGTSLEAHFALDDSVTDTEPTDIGEQSSAKIPEILRRDALPALINLSVLAPGLDHEHDEQVNPTTFERSLDHTESISLTVHPPTSEVTELWQLFARRVDPLIKVVHCPTFAIKLFTGLSNPKEAVSSTLASAIYYAAVASCSTAEIRSKFGEDRGAKLRRYAQAIDSGLAEFHGAPDVELMQALLIYLICLRRSNQCRETWAIFSLAVRTAQAMGLSEDPGDSYSAFDAEMRRRMWWALCSIESRQAEEHTTKVDSIMDKHAVRLPANLDDDDLDPGSAQVPEPRRGITQMSFVLARYRVMQATCRIRNLNTVDSESNEETKSRERRGIYKECENIIQAQVLNHCHPSRSWDRLLQISVGIMMVRLSLGVSPSTQGTIFLIAYSQAKLHIAVDFP
jgi:hypothetical protein